MARAAGRKTASTKKTSDEPKYLCHHCLKEKKKSDFYGNGTYVYSTFLYVWL